MWMIMLALLGSPSQAFADEGLDEALEKPKKGKWDPKGKGMKPYLAAEPQRQKKDYEAALPHYIDALKGQPGCGKCINGLISTLVGLERWDDAERAATLLTDLYGEEKDSVWLTRSWAMNKAERFKKAVNAADEALSMKPKSGSALSYKMSALWQMGDLDGMVAAADSAVEGGVSENDGACYKVQALSPQAAKLEEAKTEWEACQESKNNDLKLVSEGWLALAQGDVDLAGRRLLRAGAGTPTRVTLANARFEQGKHEAAANLAKAVLKEKPEVVDAAVIAARALVEMRKGEEAVEVLVATGVFGDDWKETHKGNYKISLLANGEEWVQKQMMYGLAVLIGEKARGGDEAGAESLRREAIGMYGESELFATTGDEPEVVEGRDKKEE